MIYKPLNLCYLLKYSLMKKCNIYEIKITPITLLWKFQTNCQQMLEKSYEYVFLKISWLTFRSLCRFGRKFAMIFCAVGSAVISIIQSFSVSYPMFLAFELISSTISGGVYTVTFVLGKRLLAILIPDQS